VAEPASYVDINGSGITVNYNGTEIQLTGSGGGSIPSLNQVTQVGNFTNEIITFNNRVIISQSFSQGDRATVVGLFAHAEGYRTTAGGDSSHAEGGNPNSSVKGGVAAGVGSHAEGILTTSIGIGSHVEGESSTSIGIASHAEGDRTTSIGDYSHAEGQRTTAKGGWSHAEGFLTIANSLQTVVGNQNVEITNTGAFVVGTGDAGVRQNGLEVYRSGTGGNIVRLPNLPTSATGLPTGALWNNSGSVNIV
jgi:hypothetical protein